MRVLCLGFAALACAFPLQRAVADDEPPATKAEVAAKQPAPAAPAIAAQRIALEGTVTALAADHSGEALLVGTSDGFLRGWRIGHGPTLAVRLGESAVTRVAVDPTGRRLAGATAKEVLVLDRSTQKILWRKARPVGFAFSPDGERLISVASTGVLTAAAVKDGSVLATRRVGGKRTVLRVVFGPTTALAVLGVADG